MSGMSAIWKQWKLALGFSQISTYLCLKNKTLNIDPWTAAKSVMMINLFWHIMKCVGTHGFYCMALAV